MLDTQMKRNEAVKGDNDVRSRGQIKHWSEERRRKNPLVKILLIISPWRWTDWRNYGVMKLFYI